MFSLTSICKSTLIITTLLLSTFSLFSFPNSPKVQAGAGNVLNLIINSKTSTDGTNWTNPQISNGGNYQNWNCGSQTLSGQEGKMPQTKGISDFDDGISLKNKAQTTNSQNQIINTQRDCETYNSKSNGQPVFAYQYSFEYKFEANKKTSESARYRVHTSQDGNYDGVLYTFTYYNYWNPTKNAWNGWENPNGSNELGGFLAYPIKNEMGVPNVGSLPKLDEKISQNGSVNSSNSQGQVGVIKQLQNETLCYRGLLSSSHTLIYCGTENQKGEILFFVNDPIKYNFFDNMTKGQKVKITANLELIGKVQDDGTTSYRITKINNVEKVGGVSANSQGQIGENFEDILKYVTARQGLSVFDSKTAKYSIENEKAESFNKFYNDNQEIRIVGKRKNLNSDTNGKPYYQITEITKMERVQTLSGGQISQNNSQNNIQTLDGGVVFMFKDVAQNGTKLLTKNSQEYFIAASSINEGSPSVKIYEVGQRYSIWGKLNTKTNEIFDITRAEKQPDQNSSKPTNSQLAKSFIEQSGNCSVPGQHILPLNSKVDCNFSFMNFNSQQNIENYIKNGGKIRAEIVAASSSGRSIFVS